MRVWLLEGLRQSMTRVSAGTLEDACGRGHPVCSMHTHVTYTRVHAALLAVGEDPVALYQKSMHAWIKFLASRTK
jgi:hypothetical protein